jgi:hypothetical protein
MKKWKRKGKESETKKRIESETEGGERGKEKSEKARKARSC